MAPSRAREPAAGSSRGSRRLQGERSTCGLSLAGALARSLTDAERAVLAEAADPLARLGDSAAG